ncbi:hypothetical protein [Microbispora bryophytorum]|uniref:hypothetical protein n=1 Tax=Microbispora bryophytorum TaxID=1460882 RepID=UPI001CC29174|nr:hypothetical protein [Microbispora camponoti]
MDGKASLLRRHGDSRRLATLLAAVVHLTSRAVDDALDLLEVLIATKLLARAERESAREKMKTLPRVERASAKLAAAVQASSKPPASRSTPAPDRSDGAAPGAGRGDPGDHGAGTAAGFGRR